MSNRYGTRVRTGIGWFYRVTTRGQAIKNSANSNYARALLNEDITAPQVRLIGNDGNQIGIVSRSVALAHARGQGLDLVLIRPDGRPPVVKIQDYGKEIFEQKKAKAAQRKKQRHTQVKEQKFRPSTDIGDYNRKVSHVMRFLESGDKVKVGIKFKGREAIHPELGMDLLKRVEKDVEEIGVVEVHPKIEDKENQRNITMTMVLAPRSRKKK